MTDQKITVHTNGNYMMQDPTTGEEVRAEGDSTVTRSAWVEQQIANGKLGSDTKIDKDNLKNPGSELDAAKKATAKQEDEDKKRLEPETHDETPRAKAPQEGEKRGASVSKRPENIDRVKTA